jgi:hypothetical protein
MRMPKIRAISGDRTSMSIPKMGCMRRVFR